MDNRELIPFASKFGRVYLVGVTKTCSFTRCTRPVKARDLCNGHYVQWQRTGTTWEFGSKPHRQPNLCTFPDCGRSAFGHGLCAGHAKQQREGRDLVPLRAHRRLPKDGLWPCSTCHVYKPVDAFTWDKDRNRPRRLCHACVNEREKQRNDSPEGRRTRRAKGLAQRYGITEAEYEDLWTRQQGRCGICATPVANLLDYDGDGRRSVHLDHCHNSLTIRGILCRDCNIGLGAFKDDPGKLRAAVNYLARDPDLFTLVVTGTESQPSTRRR